MANDGDAHLVAGDHGVNEFSSASVAVLRTRVKGDLFDRLVIKPDGSQLTGDGTVVPAIPGGTGTSVQRAATPQNTVYVSDYATGDGSTDTTAGERLAFAAAKTMAQANGVGVVVIQYEDQHYIHSGAPVHDATTKAFTQVQLPFVTNAIGVGDSQLTIIMRGRDGVAGDGTNPVAGTVVESTYTGGVFDATNGEPSMFGGPAALASGAPINNIHLVAENITFRQPDNPSLACIDAYNLARLTRRRVTCDTAVPYASITLPTNPSGVGVIEPAVSNNARIQIDAFLASGYYAGHIIAEHSEGEGLVFYKCKIANATMAGVDQSHACSYNDILTEWCQHDWAGVSLSTGLTDCTRLFVNVGLWDIEDANTGTFVPVTHIKDANNALHLRAKVLRVLASTGPLASGLIVTGGANCLLGDLAGAWVNATLTNSWVAQGAPYNTPGYRKLDDGTVLLRGIMKNGTFNQVAFTLPSGFRPSAQVAFPVYAGGVLTLLEVNTSGQVTPDNATGATAVVTLDGVRFMADGS